MQGKAGSKACGQKGKRKGRVKTSGLPMPLGLLYNIPNENVKGIFIYGEKVA